ncbi:MAG: response regulator transcription factor [Betaproteobacteria bacterium]|nr:response regulator transcription factor [Betaproteobacteria bacterium]
MIRVVIIDDHAILRRGLTQIIAESGNMQVVGEAETSADAMRLLRDKTCDVVLLDISLPDRNGIETLKLIRKEFPALHILMLSMHPENQYAVRALKAGAAGYLTKQSAPSQLVSAIRQVTEGRKYVTPSVAQELANSIGEDSERPQHETLSIREYQTLCMIASGKNLTDIARHLSISVKTVSVYRARVLEKMRLKNNAELTHYAIKNQIID